MAFGKRAEFDKLRELAFGSITLNYLPLGIPLNVKPRIIGLNNGTNADIYISFDKSDNHLKLAANSYKVFDISANKIRNNGFFIGKRKVIYVKYVSDIATSGSVWAEIVHGAE